MSLIVQKYGGSSIADPQQILSIAQQISSLYKEGNQVIVVVSAMGKTTDSLIKLAHEITPNPLRRELDMLLTAGERISMSLLSIALNDLGCPAISFTGSQAGVLTDESHSNAQIKELKPIRVEKALSDGHIIVLAGFQGVSPITKEVTTLGRGGSDTTAIAMAAHFKAKRCEIRKDVDGIYTADPHIISEAHKIDILNYPVLEDMTHWGAKVLHYKAIHFAAQNHVPLYIGHAHKNIPMTEIQPHYSFEKCKPLSVNSHEQILRIEYKSKHNKSIQDFFLALENNEDVPSPQILHSHNQIYDITTPKEFLDSLIIALEKSNEVINIKKDLASVTLTYSQKPQQLPTLTGINVTDSYLKKQSFTLILSQTERPKAIQRLHTFILDSK